MADQTNIEWCDSTFNPWIGCTRVSPACDDCYAARSTPARTLGITWGAGQQRRPTGVGTWQQVRTWQHRSAAFLAKHGRRRRVFCASLADWLDNEVPIQWLVALLELIRTTPDLDWLLLSKRIGNWSSRISECIGYLDAERPADLALRAWLSHWLDGDEAPRNVWLGSTVVNQVEADRDVPKLLRVPAAVRFLSIEPMLAPIDLEQALDLAELEVCAGTWCTMAEPSRCIDAMRNGSVRLIDWVICGGESGPKARPMHPDWARTLRDQCADAGVPFLFKQWGEWVPADDDCGTVVPVTEIVGDVQWQEGKRVQVQWLSPNNSIVGHSFARLGKKAAGRALDGRTHDEWPEVRRG